MDAAPLIILLVVLVLLDLVALRYGVDSRPGPRGRPDW